MSDDCEDGACKSNLIVNYLPQGMTDEEFEGLFTAIGAVESARIIRHKSTGYSYGFGFVKYETEEDANKAIKALNGLAIQSKNIKVAHARPRGEKIRQANLYIRNLPHSFDEEKIKELFAEFGPIIQCRLLKNPAGKSRGVAFVLYDLHEQADSAMTAMNGKLFPESIQPLDVKFAADNAQKVRQPGDRHFDPALNHNFGNAPPPMARPPPFFGGPVDFGGPIKNRSAHRFNPMNASQGVDLYQTVPGPSGYPLGYGQGAPPVMPRISYQPRPDNGHDSYPPNHNYHNGGGGPSLGSGNGLFSAGPGDKGANTLFVYNIGEQTSESDLQTLFAAHGRISKINVIPKGNGYAFVSFDDREQALDAIQALNGFSFFGNVLQVSFKKNK